MLGVVWRMRQFAAPNIGIKADTLNSGLGGVIVLNAAYAANINIRMPVRPNADTLADCEIPI